MPHTLLLPSGSVADLADRAVYKLTGPDTERYLSGQITQSLSLATETSAAYTCITNAKGKIQGEAFIRRHHGEVLVDCPIELKESLYNRLDMYLIADDVELSDVSDQYHFYHILGTPEADTPDSWNCNRYGIAGFDTLTKPETSITPAENWETLRITQQIPAWGKELTEDILPPEAKIESRAISYNKGCYIGQEVISRMKSAGKVTKSLTAFQLNQNVELPFAIPHPEKPDAKAIGTITSLTQVDGKWFGLGYLATKHQEKTQFSIDSLNISPLPNV